jgi:hypothetical protein
VRWESPCRHLWGVMPPPLASDASAMRCHCCVGREVGRGRLSGLHAMPPLSTDRRGVLQVVNCCDSPAGCGACKGGSAALLSADGLECPAAQPFASYLGRYSVSRAQYAPACAPARTVSRCATMQSS